MSEILLPGQPIPNISLKSGTPLPNLGAGTYQRGGYVVSSIVGKPIREGASIEVKSSRSPNPTPLPNSIVLGTVTRISPTQAIISITVVDGKLTTGSGTSGENGEEDSGGFQGVVRLQDVRLTERDKVKIVDSFRLGDVVRCIVLSLGDARSYYLSTARNDLGVIFANSEAGEPLQPLSWELMICPKTGKKEKRKVAKPDGI